MTIKCGKANEYLHIEGNIGKHFFQNGTIITTKVSEFKWKEMYNRKIEFSELRTISQKLKWLTYNSIDKSSGNRVKGF